MPRPNQPRTIASEANLARRIAFERDARGLSYESLAKLITDAGCSMQGTAIYRIEKGDPPRRVTVDELVALAKVFQVSIDELLTPMDLIEQRRAKELISEFQAATNDAADATARLFNTLVEYLALAVNNPELHEYVEHHWDSLDSPMIETSFEGVGYGISEILRTLGSSISELAARSVLELVTPTNGARG